MAFSKELLNKEAKRIEESLSSVFANESGTYKELAEIMDYSLLGGGKRIRAFLVNQTCCAFGGSEETSIPFACALEMIHAYSLIHDDLPCMDNDDYRRGKLSNHKVYGEANALLAGDTLLTEAFRVVSSSNTASTQGIVAAVKTLATCAGLHGMCGGQFADVNGEASSFDELKELYQNKTGALIKAAVLLGYYASCDVPDSKIVMDLGRYADSIGFAFQIVDDILDVTSTVEELGKPIGSDDKNLKITSLSFMTITEANRMVKELTQEALDAIHPYDSEGILSDFAVYLASRKK